MKYVSVYRERAHLVAYLASQFPAVIAYSDPAEPDWPVIYLDTAAGQLSWHLSPDDLDLFEHVPVVEVDDPRAQWDGHTTEEKYRRLTALPAAHEAMVRAKVAEEIEATQAEWSDEEPEGPNGCCDADFHNCHRVGGELSFKQAARIARGEG